MRGAAIHFVQQIPALLAGENISPDQVDAIFTSDMVSVADLRALLPKPLRDKPIICYFHENQLTYPLENEDERDYQYGFTNITSALAADAVWFNSRYHLESFLEAVDRLLKKMPDYVPEGIAQTIRSKASVIHLGLEEDVFASKPKMSSSPPTILWNHRWEYDKNPDEFFEVLFDLQRAGIAFKLIVLGEQFRTSPPIFDAARKALDSHIVHWGFAQERSEYIRLLKQADIVVSTAIHEFFGLAVLEAIAAGCTPLLPNRLSYPELLIPEAHPLCLYNNISQCRQRLAQWCTEEAPALSDGLAEHLNRLTWPYHIARFDEAFNLR